MCNRPCSRVAIRVAAAALLLEDGMLPFAAMEAKLDRWLAREAR